MIRIRLLISGEVHGVNFRHYAKQYANSLQLTGWVKNVPEGIEMVVEGDEHTVNQLISWCRHGPPAAKVKDIKISQEKYKQEFDRFEVKY